MTTLNKQDVNYIQGVTARIFDKPENPKEPIVTRWPAEKVALLKAVALCGFDVYEAAEDLLADVLARYPGEQLRCQYIIKLEEALRAARALGVRKTPELPKGFTYPLPTWARERVVRSGMVEDICLHGIGHPNEEWLKETGAPDRHACDGCCGRGPLVRAVVEMAEQRAVMPHMVDMRIPQH